MTEHFDVLIVGAGLSGIGAAHQLQSKLPQKSYAILEARERIGGTWDLFRYPGIRSDSDMYTLGYRWRPWKEQKAIADGPDILRYIEETAKESDIDRRIRFQHRVRSASWSTDSAKWSVDVERVDTSEMIRLTCNFLYVCTGYYRYDRGHLPSIPGEEGFAGRIVHPQHWTSDVDYDGKRVVVVGSGATAVTLVPELAKRAASVVMLQRSPTYILSLPSRDPAAQWLREHLPESVAYDLARWKNVLFSLGFYQFARKQPERTKKLLRRLTRKALGEDFDLESHFSPHYQPWDQRICLVPDGDLFAALRSGRAEIVTDHIERFTTTGLRLRSGRELAADLVVTATGLEVLFLGGIEVNVDGVRLEPGHSYTYKGMMLNDVPNLALCFGYTNASWTLKADLIAEYVCRLLAHMDRTGAKYCVPRLRDRSLEDEPLVGLNSGYVQRAAASLPKQKSARPWKVFQNYVLDLFLFRFAQLEDGSMEFVRAQNPVPIKPSPRSSSNTPAGSRSPS